MNSMLNKKITFHSCMKCEKYFEETNDNKILMNELISLLSCYNDKYCDMCCVDLFGMVW